jgi:hypothetical protein
MRGDTMLDLAEILSEHQPEEAAAAAREAIRLCEQKGNLVSAKRARVLLEQCAVHVAR